MHILKHITKLITLSVLSSLSFVAHADTYIMNTHGVWFRKDPSSYKPSCKDVQEDRAQFLNLNKGVFGASDKYKYQFYPWMCFGDSDAMHIKTALDCDDTSTGNPKLDSGLVKTREYAYSNLSESSVKEFRGKAKSIFKQATHNPLWAPKLIFDRKSFNSSIVQGTKLGGNFAYTFLADTFYMQDYDNVRNVSDNFFSFPVSNDPKHRQYKDILSDPSNKIAFVAHSQGTKFFFDLMYYHVNYLSLADIPAIVNNNDWKKDQVLFILDHKLSPIHQEMKDFLHYAVSASQLCANLEKAKGINLSIDNKVKALQSSLSDIAYPAARFTLALSDFREQLRSQSSLAETSFTDLANQRAYLIQSLGKLNDADFSHLEQAQNDIQKYYNKQFGNQKQPNENIQSNLTKVSQIKEALTALKALRSYFLDQYIGVQGQVSEARNWYFISSQVNTYLHDPDHYELRFIWGQEKNLDKSLKEPQLREENRLISLYQLVSDDIISQDLKTFNYTKIARIIADNEGQYTPGKRTPFIHKDALQVFLTLGSPIGELKAPWFALMPKETMNGSGYVAATFAKYLSNRYWVNVTENNDFVGNSIKQPNFLPHSQQMVSNVKFDSHPENNKSRMVVHTHSSYFEDKSHGGGLEAMKIELQNHKNHPDYLNEIKERLDLNP